MSGTSKNIFAEGTNPTARRESDGIMLIDPANIVVEEGFNSRVDFDIDDLVDSIEKNGVKNPIAVVPMTDDDGFTRYRLVDGERRYRASLKVRERGGDLARIPAMFLSKSLDKKDLIVEQIIRNKQKNFNEYELGLALQKLIDLGYTPSEAYSKCSLPAWSSIYLAHLNRDERVQKVMREGRISGNEVRKIYRNHGNDEKGAVEEILKAIENVDKQSENNPDTKKKKRITIKDLDIEGKTLTAKTDKTILQGIEKIFEIYRKYADLGNGKYLNIEIDITDLYNRLREGEHANNIFADYASKAVTVEELNSNQAAQ